MIAGLFWLIKTFIFGKKEEKELLISTIKECYKINLELLEEQKQREQQKEQEKLKTE